MNMNVSPTEELANFVKAMVSGGRYASSSEVVREALLLIENLERQEAETLGRFARRRAGVYSGDADAVGLHRQLKRKPVGSRAKPWRVARAGARLPLIRLFALAKLPRRLIALRRRKHFPAARRRGFHVK